MNGNPALKLLRSSLFAVAWLACSAFLVAQQNSSAMTGSGLAPKASDQTGAFNYPSKWTSGEISGGGASSAKWVAGEANFREGSASSWIAGGGNFRLANQQNGIWRLRQDSQVHLNTSVESNDQSAPPGMTLKGAALLKGAGLSPSLSARGAKAFGFRGFATPDAATPSSDHAPGSGDFGTGIEVNSTQHTSSPATIGSSLHDRSNLDEDLPSLDPLESGPEGANHDTSH